MNVNSLSHKGIHTNIAEESYIASSNMAHFKQSWLTAVIWITRCALVQAFHYLAHILVIFAKRWGWGGKLEIKPEIGKLVENMVFCRTFLKPSKSIVGNFEKKAFFVSNIYFFILAINYCFGIYFFISHLRFSGFFRALKQSINSLSLIYLNIYSLDLLYFWIVFLLFPLEVLNFSKSWEY